jgi:hypothetical protein
MLQENLVLLYNPSRMPDVEQPNSEDSVDTPDIKNFIFVSFFSSWFIPL